MCQTLGIHRSGYHAWQKQPSSKHAREDKRLTGLIKQFWLESGGVYGYRKIHMDLKDVGESCSRHRVLRLMKQSGLRSQVGYKKHRGKYGVKPAKVADNILNQDFKTQRPNQAWVTDITYIRTHQGWLYLAVVIDLYSRQVIGWSMQSRIETTIVLNALLMAVWQRKPKQPVVIHSDQGSQFTGYEWQAFLQEHNLTASMSRRGNCYDNAVAESFFQLLKRERIKRKIYKTRDEARSDIFDYIEMFYNTKRRHGYTQNLPPKVFEQENL